ncbi:unnamed protein product [Linum tenue]|uniref:Uncharacterized protein n=1 Tax=Linum tenue TaxID=586396 RepID=A0AAV0PEJ5_9ROSI|nr:unnamed protein product [Linum tenue]
MREKKTKTLKKDGKVGGNVNNKSSVGNDVLMEVDLEPVMSSSVRQTEVDEPMYGEAESTAEQPRTVKTTNNAISEKLRKQDQRPSSGAPSSIFNDTGVAQRSMSLGGEIDVENRARLQNMSAEEEIAEAQAEIMEKMNSSLLNLLKKRGQQKLKQQNVSESDVALEKQPANETPSSCTSWNAWSDRVEAARGVRFSLEGNVIPVDFETGAIPNDAGGADCLTERDYLRTEGDPGAAGYSIKEAVQLTRSVAIFGQQIATYLHLCTDEILPPLDKCVGRPEGYLEPVENNEAVLQGYMKSWVSGPLDRSATRGSMVFALVLHHLSSFIFLPCAKDRIVLRNKLAQSLIRDCSQKPKHEYNYPSTSPLPETPDDDQNDEDRRFKKRFEMLADACDSNSYLLSVLEKLKSAFAKKRIPSS